MWIMNEICNECGKDVSLGNGLFVDRIPDFDCFEQRLDNGKPYPHGDFMCRQCENKVYNH